MHIYPNWTPEKLEQELRRAYADYERITGDKLGRQPVTTATRGVSREGQYAKYDLLVNGQVEALEYETLDEFGLFGPIRRYRGEIMPKDKLSELAAAANKYTQAYDFVHAITDVIDSPAGIKQRLDDINSDILAKNEWKGNVRQLNDEKKLLESLTRTRVMSGQEDPLWRARLVNQAMRTYKGMMRDQSPRGPEGNASRLG